MTTYTIDADNNITAFGSAKEAEAQSECFTSQQELTDLATNRQRHIRLNSRT